MQVIDDFLEGLQQRIENSERYRTIIEKLRGTQRQFLGIIHDRNFSHCFQAKIVGTLYCLLALPSWWTRFGALTAMDNIGRERR